MSVYKRDKATGRIVKNLKPANQHESWFFDFTRNNKRYKRMCPDAITKAHAEECEREARQAVREKRFGKPDAQTLFSTFVNERYLPWAKQHKKSVRSDAVHLRVMCQHFKGKALRDITTADINTYLRERLDTPTNRKQPRSRSSVNREQMLLSGVFTLAISEQYADSNPVKGIRKHKETGRRQRVISDDEERKILTSLKTKDPVLFSVVMIGLHTGARCGEIVTLEWEHVDFAAGTDGIVRLGVIQSKTNEARDVSMNGVLRNYLLSLKPENATGRILPISEKYASQKFSAFCKELGLMDVTLHTLRHTVNTRLMQSNVNPLVSKDLLGHSKIDMTAYYAHVTEKDIAQAVKTLEKGASSSFVVPLNTAQAVKSADNSL